jgi:hypothetical protein
MDQVRDKLNTMCRNRISSFYKGDMIKSFEDGKMDVMLIVELDKRNVDYASVVGSAFYQHAEGTEVHLELLCVAENVTSLQSTGRCVVDVLKAIKPMSGVPFSAIRLEAVQEAIKFYLLNDWVPCPTSSYDGDDSALLPMIWQRPP